MKRDYMKSTIRVNGEEIDIFKIDNTVNGVPRYVVHFLSLNVQPKDYGYISGLTKYRAKWFGGGYVFQSYNVHDDLAHYLDLVKKHYKREGLKALQEAGSMTDDELLQTLDK